MAPSKNDSQSSSNCYGENVASKVNILASAYCVDSSARLTGFHYSTTGAGGMCSRPPLHHMGPSGIPEVGSGYLTPPSSPPLAALTSANELAILNRKRDNGRRKSRKEGAAYAIRGECERLFCETMKSVFLGDEGHTADNGSIELGADGYSPSDERLDVQGSYFARPHTIDAWIEVWDYVGGCSFRGYVGGNGDQKSLFAFFDSSIVGRDMKQGLMALIELAETVFAVSQVVICLDRSTTESDHKAFLKSLRWVGFELITLDMWANDHGVTSDKWLFMGMEM